jgi:hypothetical protein
VDYTNVVVEQVLALTSALDKRWLLLNQRSWGQGEVTISEYIKIRVSSEAFSLRLVAVVDTIFFISLGNTSLPYSFSDRTLHLRNYPEASEREIRDYHETGRGRNLYYDRTDNWEDFVIEDWRSLIVRRGPNNGN